MKIAEHFDLLVKEKDRFMDKFYSDNKIIVRDGSDPGTLVGSVLFCLLKIAEVRTVIDAFIHGEKDGTNNNTTK